MKSIKEKAEEYAKTKYTNQNLIEIVSWDFEAGANYVLEEVESLMKGVSDEYPQFQQGTIIHGRLIKLLEQLKK